MTSHEQTTNHGLYVHGQGDPNWQYESDMRSIESRLLIRDEVENSGEYDPHEGALLLADDGQMLTGNGEVWTDVPWRDFQTLADDHDQLAGDHGSLRDDHDALEAAAAKTADDEEITGNWTFADRTTANNLDSGTAYDFLDLNVNAGEYVGFYARDNSNYILQGHHNGNVEVPNGQLSEQGSRVATRTWTSSNFNDYTDSDAQSAIHNTDLFVNTLEVGTNLSSSDEDILLGANANIASDSSIHHLVNDGSNGDVRFGFGNTVRSGVSYSLHIDADGTVNALQGPLRESGLRVATRNWVASNYNDYTFSESHNDLSGVGSSDHHTRFSPSEARSAVNNSNVNVDSVDGYDIHKNGSDTNGVINFKT